MDRPLHKNRVVCRCDRCGKLAYQENATPDGCECYMGPRWVSGVWFPYSDLVGDDDA